MDQSITNTLITLIPTYPGPPPQEVIDLAASLLAQSRSKASSLKGEEEIAREYACAHLAVERLRQSLSLPRPTPRPPCPPRIYSRLYRYLDTALPAGTRRSGRPARPSNQADTATSSPAPNRITPRKSSTPQYKGAAYGTLASRKRPIDVNRNDRNRDPIPQWLTPSVRHICNATGSSAAIPHVFAGLSSVLSLPSISPISPTKEKLFATLIVLYLLVIIRLSPSSDSSGDEFGRAKSRAIEVLLPDLPKDNESEKEDERTVKKRMEDTVLDCIDEAKEQGWAEMEWLLEVPAGGGLQPKGHEARNEGMEGDGGESEEDEDGIAKGLGGRLDVDLEEDEDDGVLRPGLGTMMQDRYDYGSASHERAYEKWKANILARCDEMERNGKVAAAVS